MNDSKLIKEGKICFVIEGGYFTDLTRSLWADEGDPTRAIQILTTAFPDMPRSQVLSVLQGEKKLTGDSKIGIELEDDGAELSSCGNSLLAGNVIGKIQNELKLANDRARDMSALYIGETHTESCASPKGLVVYPLWRKKAFLAGEIELDDMVHKTLGSAGLSKGYLSRSAKAEDEKDDKPDPPPKPERSISTDSGWLSPEGKFYPCGYMEHIGMARRLGIQESSLEKLGWVKLARSEFFAPDRDATQSQIDMIWDWCQEHNKSMPWWTKDEDDER